MKKLSTIILASSLLLTTINTHDVEAATKVKQNIDYTNKSVAKLIKRGKYSFNGLKLGANKYNYLNKSQYEMYGGDCCINHRLSKNDRDTAFADYIDDKNPRLTRIVDYYEGKTITPAEIKKIYGKPTNWIPDYSSHSSYVSYIYVYPNVTFRFRKWDNDRLKLDLAIQTNFDSFYQKKWVKMMKEYPSSSDIYYFIEKSEWSAY